MGNPQYPHGPHGHPIEVLHDIHRRAGLPDPRWLSHAPIRQAHVPEPVRAEEVLPDLPFLERWGSGNRRSSGSLGWASRGTGSSVGPFPAWNCSCCGQRQPDYRTSCFACGSARVSGRPSAENRADPAHAPDRRASSADESSASRWDFPVVRQGVQSSMDFRELLRRPIVVRGASQSGGFTGVPRRAAEDNL